MIGDASKNEEAVLIRAALHVQLAEDMVRPVLPLLPGFLDKGLRIRFDHPFLRNQTIFRRQDDLGLSAYISEALHG